MPLKFEYDSKDDIPEEFRETSLYVQRNGKWVANLEGAASTGDVQRLQESLRKEKADHKETRASLAVWDGLDHDEVVKSLDRIPELEAAAKDKIDDAKLEEMAEQRAERRVASIKASMDREAKKITTERDEAIQERDDLRIKDRNRRLGDEIRKVATGGDTTLVPTAIDDAIELGLRVFDETDDGTFLTKDGVGVAPASDVPTWLAEMVERRPHWLPQAQGAGSTGTGRGGGFVAGKDNPWSKAGWNVTAQHAYVKLHGSEKAAKMAEAVGSHLHATRPPEK